MKKDYRALRRLLFQFYDTHRRDLPWRINRTAYKTWISEVMLQQTRVDTVIPYYNRFILQYPNISSLAQSSQDDLLKTWEGLGYYARARNLRDGAQRIVVQHNGIFPSDKKILLELPGIGPYIASAIRSMVFGKAEAAVDGNLIRVISRLHTLSGASNSSDTRKTVDTIANEMICKERPGDFNEAMMDLGALICTPRAPLCVACPFQSFCNASEQGVPEEYPIRSKTMRLPKYPFTVCVILIGKQVMVRMRPENGLLGGLYELVMIPGLYDEVSIPKVLKDQLDIDPKNILSIEKLPYSSHRFSHLIWQMQGYRICIKNKAGIVPFSKSKWDGRLISLDEAKRLPFPTACKIYHNSI